MVIGAGDVIDVLKSASTTEPSISFVVQAPALAALSVSRR
jgi:hypothetical protein